MTPVPRSSGVQLHITSLPGGRLGPPAYAFVDWLATAGQTWWQVLPLVPPDEFASPYKSDSAFAASPGLLADPSAPVPAAARRAFLDRSRFWIDDWVAFAGGDALENQVRFDVEWGALRAYGRSRGIRIIGDIPIYVAPDGVDHRVHRTLFQTGCVAGTPPDAYSDTGQLWGNPLYDWSAMRREGYRWWIERLRRARELYDLTRLDHFRGLVAYWAVPAADPSALAGRWRPGPGRRLFDAVAASLGEVPLIAEDLGVITPPVERLRDALGLPGMLIMQLGYDPRDPRSPHRLARHSENRVVYTGTHDNDTVAGWFAALDASRAAYALRELSVATAAEVPWAMTRVAWSSPACVAMVQAQDLLGLGSAARMNTPSVEGGNWEWRMEEGALDGGLAARLLALTAAAGRLAAGK